MYSARIDAKKQRFIIEDKDRNLIAEKSMPQQKYPNPGTSILLDMPDNLKAWRSVCSLVDAANNKT